MLVVLGNNNLSSKSLYLAVNIINSICDLVSQLLLTFIIKRLCDV
jgi:hypothetical protein